MNSPISIGYQNPNMHSTSGISKSTSFPNSTSKPTTQIDGSDARMSNSEKMHEIAKETKSGSLILLFHNF